MKHQVYIAIIGLFLHSCKPSTIDMAYQKEFLPEAVNIEEIIKVENILYCAGGYEKYGVIYKKSEDGNWDKIYETDRKFNTIVANENKIAFLGEDMLTVLYYPETELWENNFPYEYYSAWPKTKSSYKDAVSTKEGIVIVAGRDQINGNIYSVKNIATDNVAIKNQSDNALYSLCKISEDTLLLSGYGTVIKLCTNGYTKQLMEINGDIYTGIDYCEGSAIMCGFSGNIYRSTDNGKHWNTVFKSAKNATKTYLLNDIKYVDKNRIFATGEKGAILFSNNEGSDWEIVNYNEPDKFRNITRIDNNIYITGSSGIILTFTL